MNKGIVLLVILAMSVFLTGCGDTKTPGQTFIGGSEALKTTFLQGSPPTTVTDGGTGTFGIVIKMENIGENTINANDGYVQIWGLDARTYGSTLTDFKKPFNQQTGFGTEVLGARRAADGSVLNGGIATVDFGNLAYGPTTQGDTPQTIWANMCYKYKTNVAAQVCIVNNAEQALNDNKICSVEGEKNPQNSGAPIQVSSLKETYAGSGKIGLTLTITHVGTGDAFFKDDQLNCNNVPSNVDKGKVKVTFKDVQVGGRAVPVQCTGTDNGYVRLFADAGGKETYTLQCTLDTTGINTVVEVPVAVELSYVYLQHVEQSITIRHIAK